MTTMDTCQAQGCVCSPDRPCDEDQCDGAQYSDGSTVHCTMCMRAMAEIEMVD